ncbi:hypothetical protein GOB81_06030 [Acetobacter sp. LMG 1627]|uniref:Glycerophosphodiester phosphodiesterase n=1 Tax=Acetobacter conturbans TaxID=1737472 RepID=A0ABX0JXW2_9PROT|nr:hypothetical protein [Acetobacter conturbans]
MNGTYERGLEHAGQTGRRSVLTPRCRRNGLVALAIIVGVGGGMLWRDSHADALLTRIHHGLVICASGKAATQTLPVANAPETNSFIPTVPSQAGNADSSDLPSMVSLAVTRNTAGELVVSTDRPVLLSDALASSRKRHELVMLSLHDVPAAAVVRSIRTNHMRKQAVLIADTTIAAQEALEADRAIIVAFPVKSVADERKAKQIAGRHPYALYLPANASSMLFQAAHREADAVIANSPDPLTNRKATQQLLNEPVDIVVTDYPDRFADILDGT